MRLNDTDDDRARRDVDEEIAFHVDMRVRKLVGTGMSCRGAEECARREFGDVVRARTRLRRDAARARRRRRRSEWIGNVLRDARHGARAARRAARHRLPRGHARILRDTRNAAPRRARTHPFLVLRDGFRLAAAGVLIGIVVAFAAARAMSALLFGVAPHDALTFVAVPLVVLAVARLATLPPAARAARIDPAHTLR